MQVTAANRKFFGSFKSMESVGNAWNHPLYILLFCTLGTEDFSADYRVWNRPGWIGIVGVIAIS